MEVIYKNKSPQQRFEELAGIVLFLLLVSAAVVGAILVFIYGIVPSAMEQGAVNRAKQLEPGFASDIDGYISQLGGAGVESRSTYSCFRDLPPTVKPGDKAIVIDLNKNRVYTEIQGRLKDDMRAETPQDVSIIIGLFMCYEDAATYEDGSVVQRWICHVTAIKHLTGEVVVSAKVIGPSPPRQIKKRKLAIPHGGPIIAGYPTMEEIAYGLNKP